MIFKSAKRGTALACAMGFALLAPVAMAQTITIGDVEIQDSATTAVVPLFVDHDFDLAAFVLAVTFDNEALVSSYQPQYFDGEGGVDCPAFVGALNYSCSTPNPNQFNFVVNSGSPAVDVPAGQFGIVTFNLTGLSVDDVITLTIISESYSDQDGTPVPPSGESSGGTITVVAGPPAVLDVSPLDINFGGVRVGETSGESPIAICNDGIEDAADLNVTGISVAGTGFAEGAGSTCPGTPFDLAQGECCNFHVTFSPDAEAGFTGSVNIETSAGGETVELSGQGTVTDASLTIDPTAFDFEGVDIDAGAVCQDFDVSNTPGDDSLTVGTASVGGPPFSITANSCNGATLGGGESCMVTVCFDPDAEGNFTDTLAVTSDVNEVSAALSGNGTATAVVGVVPEFSTGPDDVISIGVGEPGTTVSFTAGEVTNTGSADADVACEFTSNPDGLFSTDPSPLAGTVAAGGGSIGFSLFCDLPGDADEGDLFTATLSCSVDGEPAGEHFLSCGVRVFDPIPINTLQPLGLALFALLMLLIGGISIRLFRAS
ncbi:MAG: choice-of-anchor D domain-containing protein [Wenzhouxiangella sp.]|nr:MAG: choice-of-anchor D domain-containing protein [Wenzhouxiangella sp.]